MLSEDGKCYTFDERANGYVRAEGAVMLLLKPLEKALEDGDVKWKSELGGRIVGSANIYNYIEEAVTNTIVLVGSYDHFLYGLNFGKSPNVATLLVVNSPKFNTYYSERTKER